MLLIIEMFVQVKSRAFYSKVKIFDTNLLVKGTQVTRHFLFKLSCLQMSCVAWVSPAAKRDDKMIFLCFLSSFFFVVFVISMLFFYLLIFELTGPNLMKNRPCQNHSPLPGLWLFSSFVCMNTFLKFLSLAKVFIARKLNLSFLNKYQDLMTKRLSNSS